MSLMKEFREFAMRGNVIDLAVGVVIGGAFGKIISSLVANIIMPPLNSTCSRASMASTSTTSPSRFARSRRSSTPTARW